MASWRQAGRVLQALREGCGWSVPMLAVELEAQARVIGRPLTNRESLVRRIYDWEAGGHRPRDYYVLFILVYASDEELAARTIVPGSELDRLMGALKMMGVPVNRRKFLLNSAALAAGVAGVPTVATDLEGQQRLAWMLKHPRSVDLPTVAYLGQQAVSLLKQNEAMPSTSLLPAAIQQLEQVTLLRGMPRPGPFSAVWPRSRPNQPPSWAGWFGTCPASATMPPPAATTTRPSIQRLALGKDGPKPSRACSKPS